MKARIFLENGEYCLYRSMSFGHNREEFIPWGTYKTLEEAENAIKDIVATYFEYKSRPKPKLIKEVTI